MEICNIGKNRTTMMIAREMPIIRHMIAGEVKDLSVSEMKNNKRLFELEIATNEKRVKVIIEQGATTKEMVKHLREMANKLEYEYMRY